MPKSTLSEWDKLNDSSFYRKHSVYSITWDTPVRLDYSITAGASFGGALAICSNSSKLQPYRGPDHRSSIAILNNAGGLIQQLPWDKGRIKGLGWSNSEHLIVVTEDGKVRRYTDFQVNFTQFSLGREAESQSVVDCRFWGTGFVARLANSRLVVVSRYDEPRPRYLDANLHGATIHSWTIIPPHKSMSYHAEVIIAAGPNSIFLIDSVSSQERSIKGAPFQCVSLSPDGDMVALLSKSGPIFIYSADFTRTIAEFSIEGFNLGTDQPSPDLTWCGNQAIVLADKDEVRIADFNGGTIDYYFDSQVALVTEIDGIRIVSESSCDYLYRVPDAAVRIFQLGSIAPASVLVDAVDQLETDSIKADESFQLIKSDLTKAVDDCIIAATYEWDTSTQKRLMKAASIGKSILNYYDSDSFVEASQTIRVLNALRDYKLGFAISYEQYLRLTPERAIERLLSRHDYLPALKISNYLKLPVEPVYLHWACEKAKFDKKDDQETCSEIVERLTPCKGISYEDIAQTAFNEGRSRLATLLLNYEPRASHQVPLLLAMQENEAALTKAIDYGDSDLVYYVLLKLKQELPLAQFFKLVNDKPRAAALVEVLARHEDLELLKDFYYQADKRDDGVRVIFQEALQGGDVGTRIEKVKIAAKLLGEVKNRTNDAKAMDEYGKLLTSQSILERDYEQKFFGLSAVETIGKLIRIGQSAKANKLKSEFKVNDKQFQWARLKALISRRDWSEIENILNQHSHRKPPTIGFEAYYSQCLQAGNLQLAAKFIPKCSHLTAQSKIQMFLAVKDYSGAASEALTAKDLSTLRSIRQQAPSSGPIARDIDAMIQKLSGVNNNR